MKCLLMVMIWVLATLTNSDIGDGAGDDLTITWNVGDGTSRSYNEFLSSLRDKVLKGSTEIYHGVPMLPKRGTAKFLLAVLQSSEPGKTITLTLDENDLYLMGYSDKLDDGTCRYHVFRTKNGKASVCDNSADKRCRLCQGETKVEKKEIPYTFDYGTLEKKAGGKSRTAYALGVRKLDGWIKTLYKPDKDKEMTDEPTFLLVAIQMVSEAARFSYIQKKTVKGNFNPDDLTICLEKNWDKASKRIKDTKGKVLNPPFECDNFKWKAKKVARLTSCMAILCHQDQTNALASLLSRFLTYFVSIGNQDGDDDTEL